MKEARYTWNNQIRVTVVTRRPSPKKSVAITAWHVCGDDQIFVGIFVTIRLMLLPPLRGKGLAGRGQQKICLSCPEVRVLHHCLSSLAFSTCGVTGASSANVLGAAWSIVDLESAKARKCNNWLGWLRPGAFVLGGPCAS